MNCLNFKTEFEAKRTDARFCSDSCRKKLSRTNNSDKIISDIKTDKLETFGKGWNGEDMLYCESCLFHVVKYCKDYHNCKHYLKDYDITVRT